MVYLRFNLNLNILIVLHSLSPKERTTPFSASLVVSMRNCCEIILYQTTTALTSITSKEDIITLNCIKIDKI